MVHAFIMMRTGTGESEQLLGPIRDFGTVAEVHIVAGAYDTIAKVNTSAVYEMLKTASSRVQGLEDVIDTKTYASLDD